MALLEALHVSMARTRVINTNIGSSHLHQLSLSDSQHHLCSRNQQHTEDSTATILRLMKAEGTHSKLEHA